MQSMVATTLLPFGHACLAAGRGVGLAAMLALAPPALADAAQLVPAPAAEIPQAPRLRALDLAPFAAAIAGLTAEREAEILAMVSTADLATIQEALWDGSLTSVDLTTFYLARIARHDDRLRAFLELNPDALAEAEAADAAFSDGQVRGLLQGIPVALKDNIETLGPMRTTANAAILLDNVAAGDAEIVTRLRAAEAVVLGKTSLSEFAGAVQLGAPLGGAGAVGGQGMNPHGPFPVYGSSSGSAIAVAALLTHVAVGTETSGSLIAPATGSGVVALKPTWGRVPATGIIPLIARSDTAGPIARTVADAAALLAVLDGSGTNHGHGFALSALDGVTVGLLAADIAGNSNYSEALSRATTSLTALGARLRPAELLDPTGQVPQLAALLGTGMRHEVAPYISARRPEIATLEALITWNAAEPSTRAPFGQDILLALAQISDGLGAADHARLGEDLAAAATAALESAFKASGAEVLVSTYSLHAPFYATAGWPAVTVPLGLNDAGWPMGATLIGRKGEDARLLAFAWALERGTQARVTPSLVDDK